jgi:hypothetical protein
VDRAYYEEIAGQLHGLLIRLDDRLPGKDGTLIAEFIDANELRVAMAKAAPTDSVDLWKFRTSLAHPDHRAPPGARPPGEVMTRRQAAGRRTTRTAL